MLFCRKRGREKADSILEGPQPQIGDDKTVFIKKVENALSFGMLIAYVQGFEFLRIASNEKKFGLNLSDVARIWRGGCIIRSAMLEDFMNAYKKHPELPNLLFDNQLSSSANLNQTDLRDVIIQAVNAGIPVPGFMSALGYFDAYRSGHLAANMIQAQRDYFGSHKYQKIGEEGIFHTDW